MVARKPAPWVRVARLCQKAAEELKSRHSNDQRRSASQGIVDRLRSEEPLDSMERAYIADLIAGELTRTRGRRLTPEEQRRQREEDDAVRAVWYQARDEGKPISRETAVSKVVEGMGMKDDRATKLLNRVIKYSSIL